jgi:cell division protein FtsW (lipid II flippase)
MKMVHHSTHFTTKLFYLREWMKILRHATLSHSPLLVWDGMVTRNKTYKSNSESERETWNSSTQNVLFSPCHSALFLTWCCSMLNACLPDYGRSYCLLMILINDACMLLVGAEQKIFHPHLLSASYHSLLALFLRLQVKYNPRFTGI